MGRWAGRAGWEWEGKGLGQVEKPIPEQVAMVCQLHKVAGALLPLLLLLPHTHRTTAGQDTGRQSPTPPWETKGQIRGEGEHRNV